MGAKAEEKRNPARRTRPQAAPIAMVMKPRYPGQVRRGKGFSLGELRQAGLTPEAAEKLGIKVDRRRRSVHQGNVEALRALLKPRRTKRAKAPGEKAQRRGRRRTAKG